MNLGIWTIQLETVIICTKNFRAVSNLQGRQIWLLPSLMSWTVYLGSYKTGKSWVARKEKTAQLCCSCHHHWVNMKGRDSTFSHTGSHWFLRWGRTSSNTSTFQGSLAGEKRPQSHSHAAAYSNRLLCFWRETDLTGPVAEEYVVTTLASSALPCASLLHLRWSNYVTS